MKKSRGVIATIAAVTLALTLAACDGGSSSPEPAPKDTSPRSLTLILQSPPVNLDPAKATLGADDTFIGLTYATITRMDGLDKYEPDLAKEWGYIGDGNKKFFFVLRDGLKFADGTPLTAAEVVKSFQYVQSTKRVEWMNSIEAVTAIDATRVELTMKSPLPELPMLLSQTQLAAGVISPAGLKDPAALASASFGAGPYVLDTAKTVTGNQYVYTPNPNFYDQSIIQWADVTIKIVPNPTSVLNGLMAKQADFATIAERDAPAAEKAGLTVLKYPSTIQGINLADRDGKLDKPLADLRVRQALNYAIDRNAIAKAVFGDFGEGTSQLPLPGQPGFVQANENLYPYDVAKAKALLAEAGYPNGFTLKGQIQAYFNLNAVTEAVFEQWKAIGVTVDAHVDTVPAASAESQISGRYSVFGFGWGPRPMMQTANSWLLPIKSRYNPFVTADAELSKDVAAVAAAPSGSAESSKQFEAAMTRLVQQAWVIPVVRLSVARAYNPATLTNVYAKDSFSMDVAWRFEPVR